MILADVHWMSAFKPCGLERCEREHAQRGGIGTIMCFHSSRILAIHVVSCTTSSRVFFDDFCVSVMICTYTSSSCGTA
jgi:hypothetical protein